MFKLLKYLIILVILLVIGAGVGLYFMVNKLIKDGVEKVASDTLEVPVTVREVKLSPFSGTGTIKGLVIANPEGYHTEHAFALDRIVVSLDVKSLFSDRIVINTLHVDSPSVFYEVGLGNSNIGTIKKNAMGEASDEPDDEEGKAITIADLRIARAEVAVSAKILQGKAASMTLADFEMKNIDSERPEEVIAEVLGQFVDQIVKAAVDEDILPEGVGVVKDVVDTGKEVLDTTKKVFGVLKDALNGKAPDDE